MSTNPMQSAHGAPRCKAKSKRTGSPCRAPAVRGWGVCRMHGAGGGGPSGRANGNYRHGGRTKRVTDVVRYINALAKKARCP
jgi:glucans biosynthesis protein